MEFLEEIKEVLKTNFYPVYQTQNWLTGQVGRPLGRPNQGPVDRMVPAVKSDRWPVDRSVDR